MPRKSIRAKYSTHRRVIFDIETIPDYERVSLLTKPFDKASVKVGNIKDPDKILEKIQKAEEDHIKKERDKAALHPETARVCAIGLFEQEIGFQIFDAERDGEKEIIEKFWKLTTEILNGHHDLVGFNIKKFDLPFLIRRSFHLDIEPSTFLLNFEKRRWHSGLIDLMEQYASAEWGYMISLDRLCRSLGIGGKEDTDHPISGKWFWKWWISQADSDLSKEEQRKVARDYLENDIKMTSALADRLLGVIQEPDEESESFADEFLDDQGRPFITLYKQKESEDVGK